MNQLPSAEIAGRIVAAATQGAATPFEVASAMERVLPPLYRTTSDLLGQEGFWALLARARFLAGQQHPLLATLEIRVESSLTVEHVEAAVRREGADAVSAAVTTLVAQLLTLLVSFIGDDLTVRLIQRTWALPISGPIGGPQDGDN